MEKTIYVVEYCDQGYTDAYENADDAVKEILNSYLGWCKNHIENQDSYTYVPTSKDMCDDISSLIENHYIEDWAWIGEIKYHTN